MCAHGPDGAANSEHGEVLAHGDADADIMSSPWLAGACERLQAHRTHAPHCVRVSLQLLIKITATAIDGPPACSVFEDDERVAFAAGNNRITILWVAERMRRKGLGTLLVSLLKQRSVSGADNIVPGALRFWESVSTVVTLKPKRGDSLCVQANF